MLFKIIGTAHFTFSLITEGTTEKVFKLKIPLKSIFSKNFGFVEQNVFFEHKRNAKTTDSFIMALFCL
jgi:hypothetical protein